MIKKLIVVILLIVAALFTIIFVFSSPPRAEPYRISQIGPFNLVYIDTTASFGSGQELVGIVRSFVQDSLELQVVHSFTMILDTAPRSGSDTIRLRAGVTTQKLPDSVQVPLRAQQYPETAAIISEYPFVDFMARSEEPFTFYAQAREFADKNGYSVGDHVLEIADSTRRIVTFAVPARKM